MTDEELRAMHRPNWMGVERPTYWFDVEVGEEPEEGVEFEVVPCLGGVPPWA